MKKEKLTISMYECVKCNKTVYFRSNEEVNTKCKTCGQEMKFWWTHPYNPKNNIKQANSINKNQQVVPIQPQPSSPTITCPYCKSTDCKKISGLSKTFGIALMGIFAMDKVGKQWHCNRCKSDF